METSGPGDSARLLLEDVCSDLVRFRHSGGDPGRFGAMVIDREWPLGPPGAFADLRVEPEDGPPYFLEVKVGYDPPALLAAIRRKYGRPGPGTEGARRLVLVADAIEYSGWPEVEAELRALLPSPLQLEVWDEAAIRSMIADCFGQTLPARAMAELAVIRERIDQGKEHLAFGTAPPAGYGEQVVRHNLLWHFGTWRLAEIRHASGCADARELVPPGSYDHAVVLMTDLSAFSSYVRDTRDDALVRQMLTDFYAKSRYQVINGGGMLVQFVGDAVVAVFGVPDRRPGYVEAAARTALRLLEIGASVAHKWQRRIDHVQTCAGAHASMAMGRVQLVPMRALDSAHVATIGDCLDICARLLPLAGPDEAVISNVLRHRLQGSPYDFLALPPFEARNIGTLQPWRLFARPRGSDG
jgi:class 3 adenylate cyclase